MKPEEVERGIYAAETVNELFFYESYIPNEDKAYYSYLRRLVANKLSDMLRK